MATKLKGTYLCSAALQIGPSLSSFGYAFPHSKRDSVHVVIHHYENISQHIPTTALFRPDKTFHSFGYEADMQYEELEHTERDDWYYFKGFTAMNFDKKHNVCVLFDKTGKTMEAVRVYAAAIGYLVEQALTNFETVQNGFLQHDIHWTITAPNLTDVGARLFLTEAAIQGGIHAGDLLVIDEIDALLVYCRTHKQTDKFTSLTRSLIVDSKGSYTDLIVAKSNKILYKTYCRNVCETNIIIAFCNLMEDLCTKPVFDRSRKGDEDAHDDDDDDFVELIESKFNCFYSDRPLRFQIQKCIEMVKEELGVELNSRVQHLQEYCDSIKVSGGKIKIHEKLVTQMFKETLDNIEDQLTKIFSNEYAASVDTIVLHGKLGTCPLVVEKIERLYPQKRVITLDKDGSAYLSGAVYYGHDPALLDEITSGSDEIRTYEDHLQSLSATLRHGSDTVDDFQSLMSDEYKETCQSSLIADKKIVHLSLPFTKDTSSISFHIFGVPIAANPMDANNIVCRLLGNMTLDATHWKPHTSVNLCMCYDSKQMNIEVEEESLSDRMQALNIDNVVTTGKQEATRLALPCPSATSRISFPICVTSSSNEGVSSRVLGQFAVELKDWKKDKTVILRMKLGDEKMQVDVEE